MGQTSETFPLLQPLLARGEIHTHRDTLTDSANMVLAKSKKSVGLGNSLMNDRFGKGKNSEMHRGNAKDQGIQRTGADGMTGSIAILKM